MTQWLLYGLLVIVIGGLALYFLGRGRNRRD